MKKIFSIVLVLVAISTFAQNKNVKVKKGFGVAVDQIEPQFPGGQDSLQAFLQDNLIYPENAKREHIEGKVYVGFLVDRNGKIQKPRILSTASEELDNEALRVVGLMPDWIPGTKGGMPADVQYVLPLEFVAPPLKPVNQQ